MDERNSTGGSPAIDTRVEVVAPENIAFDYEVAGPFIRFPAYLIDMLIRFLILFGVAMALAFASFVLGDVSSAMVLIVYFILDWFYGALFEALNNGQTPGKRAMQIRVVGVDGQPIAAWQAVLRNFLRFVDMQPVWTGLGFFTLGLASSAANRRFQRLGDWAARTMVIVEQPAKLYGVASITDPHILQLADHLPRKINVERSLARVLSDYVLRRLRLHPARRREIAIHVGEPLRRMFGLAAPIDYDVLLCAVYHRIYFGDVEAAALARPAQPAGYPGAPWQAAGQPQPIPQPGWRQPQPVAPSWGQPPVDGGYGLAPPTQAPPWQAQAPAPGPSWNASPGSPSGWDPQPPPGQGWNPGGGQNWTPPGNQGGWR